MSSLSEMLAKAKVRNAKVAKDKKLIQSGKVKDLSPVDGKRSVLFGTGITKKSAEKAGREFEKLQQESFQLAEESKNDENSEYGKLVSLNIPSTLMDSDIKLDEYQQAAVDGLKYEKYGCLIGQAGVGKTTTAKAIINQISSSIPLIDLNKAQLHTAPTSEENINVAICIVSFMGKAVQQIKRALPVEYHPMCQTIHATLGYAPEMVERKNKETGKMEIVKMFRPQFTEMNKLPFKVCVIDEAGSVPVYLFNELVAALPKDARIILMGDLNQLPPVSGRSILGYAISKWPTFVLSKIHRQKGEENPIIMNADRIIKGRKPVKDDKKFQIVTMPDSAFETFRHACGAVQTLHKKGIFDPLRDAFIVPQNIDDIGQIAFNEKLVRYFNPIKEVEGVPINPPVLITAGWQHVTYAIGDKVMITKNIRDMDLTNGMIGVIKSIIPNPRFKGEAIADKVISMNGSSDFSLDLKNLDAELEKASKDDSVEEEDEKERQASHIITIQFQNLESETIFATAGGLTNLVHSYAITCHKAQGSEYPTVVVLIHSANLRMLSREWLYTAITRASERVIVLTNHRGMTQAINRQQLKGKTIQEKAERFIAFQNANLKKDEEDQAEMPNLKEPERVEL